MSKRGSSYGDDMGQSFKWPCLLGAGAAIAVTIAMLVYSKVKDAERKRESESIVIPERYWQDRYPQDDKDLRRESEDVRGRR